MTSQQRDDAQYGARAFVKGNTLLPEVFPREMGPNSVKYLQEVVESGLASDMVERFEKYFAQMHGIKHCIGTPGCTQALFATMLGMDFEPGDEIIVSSICDYGTFAGALFQHYIPVFADTEPGTALISRESIEPLITERTRAILCVHKLGLPCDMDPILELAKEHNLLVIEDVCQAILSRYKGRLAGTLGHISCFSFDAEKTCGADIGGAILTNDDEIYKRIYNRAIARGATMRPGFGREHQYQGFATRMPQCTAATTLANLEILPRQIEQRQKTATLLDRLISDIPGIIPYKIPDDRTHTYWMYGFLLDLNEISCTPDEFAEQLREAGLGNAGLGRYYLMPAAIPFLSHRAATREYPYNAPTASRSYTYSESSAPNAKAFLDRWIRWFWTEKYKEQHIHYIAEIIRGVAERNHVSRSA